MFKNKRTGGEKLWEKGKGKNRIATIFVGSSFDLKTSGLKDALSKAMILNSR